MTIIKSISTLSYRIELLEKNNKYFIRYDSNNHAEPQLSRPIVDLKIAFDIFDIRLQELEGI